MTRYARLFAAGLALVFAALPALAQIAAGKVVHIVVPCAAGGSLMLAPDICVPALLR